MNVSAAEIDSTIESSNDNFWILNLIISIFVYLLGTYINWKIICVSRRTKDKTWQEDIIHSISMMVAMCVVIVFENVSEHVKVLSKYTGGVWVCYVTAFIYSYNTFVGGFHSFNICFMKYIFIVHQEKVRQFGEDKLQKIFFLSYLIHPLLLAIPTVILLDFEAYPSLIGCFGLEDELRDRYASDGVGQMFLCKLTVDEGENRFVYLAKQAFCTFKIIWVLILSSNIPEAYMYFKIFQFMRR